MFAFLYPPTVHCEYPHRIKCPSVPGSTVNPWVHVYIKVWMGKACIYYETITSNVSCCKWGSGFENLNGLYVCLQYFVLHPVE